MIIRWLLGERIQNLTLFRASLILMVITWVTLAMMAKRLFPNSPRERLKSHTLPLSPEGCWEVLTAAAWDRAKCSGQCYLLSKQFCLTQRLVFHTSLIVTQKRSGISHKNTFCHIWHACPTRSIKIALPHLTRCILSPITDHHAELCSILFKLFCTADFLLTSLESDMEVMVDTAG